MERERSVCQCVYCMCVCVVIDADILFSSVNFLITGCCFGPSEKRRGIFFPSIVCDNHITMCKVSKDKEVSTQWRKPKQPL